jgi:tetratricopeptide (TPR) repeat protein
MRLTVFLLLIASSMFAQTVDKAQKLIEAKQGEEAKKLLLSVKEGSKEYAAARYYLGRIAFDKNEPEEASDYFEEAIEANDKVADYYNWYGNALGRDAQNANMLRQGMLAPKMKTAWEKAVALQPDFIEPRQSLIQYYLQAPGFMGGSVDKAEAMAKEIVKLKPVEGHRQMGIVYTHQKKIPEAEKEFVAMVTEDPAYVLTLANFYFTEKLYNKAFDLFEDALKKNPDDWMAVYQIGKASALSGLKLQRGEECLRKYLTHPPIQNEPNHAAANMRLAQILEKGGKKEEAKNLYALALKADATLKEAKEGLERVSN